MRAAKYLFEFKKLFFNFTYIFMYTVLIRTISIVAQIDRDTISITSIVNPNIETNIFEKRFLKRAARLGSSFLTI